MNSMFYKSALIILVSAILSACQQGVDKRPIQLNYMEYEEYVQPYPTRVIVTQDFVRFDDGVEGGDFILFDRKENIIYSVNHGEQTVMSISSKDTDIQPPMKLEVTTVKVSELKDAPEINGKKPVHHQIKVNNNNCYDVVAVKDMMPDVIDAYLAFTRILESDSRVTFNNIPADMHNECDMALNTFNAGAQYAFGFPIHEKSFNGKGRDLVNFTRDFELKEEWLKLPESYRVYSVQDLREGKVQLSPQ